ncbi:MAG: cytidylate kinase family protein, partial [Clostridia bacterium]
MEKFVITIGRQYGSGGREVGKKLAEKLGVKYYDKELIALSAENTGLEK